MRAPPKIKLSHFHILMIVALMGLSARKPSDGNTAEKFYPCSEEVFWWAVRMAESGDIPDGKCHKERGGELSCGLYQLSFKDAKQYGCQFKKFDDLFDPKLNTDCKDRIAAKLRKDGGTWDNALARYWGTMRSKNNPTWKEWHKQNPNHTGYENLQKHAASRGCKL
jgi:hypothetical protein